MHVDDTAVATQRGLPNQSTHFIDYLIRWVFTFLLIWAGIFVGIYFHVTLPISQQGIASTNPAIMSARNALFLLLQVSIGATIGCFYHAIVVHYDDGQFASLKRIGWSWITPTSGFLIFLVIGIASNTITSPRLIASILISGSIIIFLIYFFPFLFKDFSFSYLQESLLRLWRYRKLARLWLNYRIRAEYNSTILGVSWAIIEPLVSAILYAFIFSVLRAVPPTEGLPFTLFFLPAIVFLNWLTRCFNGSTRQLVSNLNVFSKVNFPKEIAILVFILQRTVDLFVAVVSLSFIMLLFGRTPTWHFLLMIPIIGLALLSMIGVGMLLGITGVIVRDSSEIVTFISRPLLFIMPTFLAFSQMNGLIRIFNTVFPFSQIVVALRQVTMMGQIPNMLSLVYIVVSSLLTLYMGYTFFISKSPIILDYQ